MRRGPSSATWPRANGTRSKTFPPLAKAWPGHGTGADFSAAVSARHHAAGALSGVPSPPRGPGKWTLIRQVMGTSAPAFAAEAFSWARTALSRARFFLL